MSGSVGFVPSADGNVRFFDQDDDEIECTGVNLPGVYSTFHTNEHENETPAEPVGEESRSTSPEPVSSPANTDNTALCLVTQESFPLATCSVLQLPSEGNIRVRLAHAWGFNSVESLDFHLKKSCFNWITLREDFISRFGSVYGGHWALVPDVDTLNRIRQAVIAHPPNAPSHYLDGFPNQMWSYEYIPLRGNTEKFLRFIPGVKDEDGNTSCTMHKFPFRGLELRSTVHPYFAIVNAAQRAIYALGGRSHIPHLPAEQRQSLEMCIELYNQWLKQVAVGNSTRSRR